MKRAGEYAELVRSYVDLIGVIKMAQKEAYNEAIDDAVMSVALKETRDVDEYNEMPSVSNDMGDTYVIDKQSILKLKK